MLSLSCRTCSSAMPPPPAHPISFGTTFSVGDTLILTWGWKILTLDIHMAATSTPWELQAFLSLGVLLCIKCRKSVSYEAWYGEGLLFGKGVLLLLVCLIDRRLAAWYLLLYAVIFLLFQQPPCKSLGNVVEMTPLQLENLLSEGSSTNCWLVEFRAVWSPQCNRAKRVFTNLSARYSTENLYFGSIDLGRFPKAGDIYGISLGVKLGQLPTYVLFEGGTEVSRLPVASNDGSVIAEAFSESSIAKHFELDRRLIFELGKNPSDKKYQQ